MTDDGVLRHRAFAVQFSDLRRWSVASFFDIAWQWPESDIKPLALALQRKQTRYIAASMPDVPPLLTVHFDGSVLPRDEDATDTKGSLFVANAGDVVYSKIDVRNGAIALVPDEIPFAVVTSEYPVYAVRTDQALSSYVQLLFRTAYFRAALNSKISGHSGRKRINPSELETVEVPLPDVSVQTRIVNVWEQALTPERAAKRELSELVAELEEELRLLCSPRLDRILRRPAMVSKRDY